MNLAINARDAMPFGGVLTIVTGATMVDSSAPLYELTAGRYVTVTVSDTGSGIAPEIQQRMFEPFFTTKGPSKGTGLGLSTAYGIMRQAHGHIEVRSEVGTGSTFTLYFPESHQPVRARAVPKISEPHEDLRQCCSWKTRKRCDGSRSASWHRRGIAY